jgi:hypothetical protein
MGPIRRHTVGHGQRTGNGTVGAVEAVGACACTAASRLHRACDPTAKLRCPTRTAVDLTGAAVLHLWGQSRATRRLLLPTSASQEARHCKDVPSEGDPFQSDPSGRRQLHRSCRKASIRQDALRLPIARGRGSMIGSKPLQAHCISILPR